MLTQERELGKIKCYKYWPEREAEQDRIAVGTGEVPFVPCKDKENYKGELVSA